MRRFAVFAAVFLALALAFNSQAVGATPGSSWLRTYGGEGTDRAFSVIQTSDGGYAIAGETTSFGLEGFGFLLLKIDSSGALEWSRTFGGENWTWARWVVQTSDGGYAMAGATVDASGGRADFLLIKTDNAGAEEWRRNYGENVWDDARSVVQASDGGYAIAGRTISPDNGDDILLVKTDNSGKEEWRTVFGGENRDEAFSVVQASDGGYVIAGYKTVNGENGADFWLIKTDNSGAEEWSRTFGGENDDYAFSVAATLDGGYAIAGVTWSFGVGESDSWLVKTDSSGEEEWSRAYGGDNQEWAYSVVRTPDGGYALSGLTMSYGSGLVDSWLVKTDNSGAEEWNKAYGGEGSDFTTAAIRTSGGEYVLAGYTDSYGAGGDDLWLIKADSSGGVEMVVPISIGEDAPAGTDYAYGAVTAIVVAALLSVLLLRKWIVRGK